MEKSPGGREIHNGKLVFTKEDQQRGGHNRKGIPNKLSGLREEFIGMMKNEMPHVIRKLEELRDDNPLEYLKLMKSFFVFVMPRKLDLTSGGEQVKPISVNVQTEEELKALKEFLNE